MTIENMKDYLKHRYPSSDWAKKVERMPDDQIIAIYKRLQQSKPPKVIHAPPRPSYYTGYLCPDCGKTFIADNPELSECRFCGSKNIIRESRTTYVRKETAHED